VKKLWLVPAMAAAAIAAGCGSNPKPPLGQDQGTDWQTCTDQQGRVVDERQCDPRTAGYRPGLFRWYYYPWGGRPYPIGWLIPMGGSYSNTLLPGVPTPSMVARGVVSGSRAGVVRGGFGKTGAGAAAGS